MMRQVSGVWDDEVLAIARELAMYRKTMNISTREFAKRANISTFPLARWENEERMPDILNLKNWAEHLGYKITVTMEPDDGDQ